MGGWVGARESVYVCVCAVCVRKCTHTTPNETGKSRRVEKQPPQQKQRVTPEQTRRAAEHSRYPQHDGKRRKGKHRTPLRMKCKERKRTFLTSLYDFPFPVSLDDDAFDFLDLIWEMARRMSFKCCFASSSCTHTENKGNKRVGEG